MVAPSPDRPPHGPCACIIGAGISGLTAAKALSDRGIPYDHYEMSNDIGGLWQYDTDNGRSAAYRTLHINSSKTNMELEDFPMDNDFPVFGHHEDVLQYFHAYADRFNLKKGITFDTRVTDVRPIAGTLRGSSPAEAASPGGLELNASEGNGEECASSGWAGAQKWSVTLGDGTTKTYDAVIVASGHHWNPRWPEFPGSFSGEEIHSHGYTAPEDFTGRRVLVVGIGNSACDIVVDLCRIADHVTLSTRSSAWVLPKYILGRPLDQWTSNTMEYLPVWVRRRLFQALVWLAVGNQESYGVPKPDHKIMEEHPTISQELLSQVGHGRVEVKPNIERLDGSTVHFADDSSSHYDAVIYATGYDISFPFLPDEIFQVEDNRVRLYRYVVPPDLPGLCFVGLIQPLGAIMPLVEKQSKWIAALLDGEVALPHPEEMHQEIDAALERMNRRYAASPRHTIQVDFWDYIRQMDREMRQGHKRAARSPVPSIHELATPAS